MVKNIKTRMKRTSIIMVMICSLVFLPGKPAFAFCEQTVAIQAAANAAQTALTATINAIVAAASGTFTSTSTATTSLLRTRIDLMNTNIRSGLGDLWDLWRTGMQDMTKELSSSRSVQSASYGAFIDSRNQTRVQKELHLKEIEARRTYQPSEQACVIDSINPNYGRSLKVAEAVQNGYEYDYTEYLSNALNSRSESGSANVLRQRWADYSEHFCDPEANKGFAGCLASVANPNPNANLDISVSKTFFRGETLDLSDANTRLGAETLIRNIIGHVPEDPFSMEIMDTVVGQQRVLQHRSQMAKYNAVASVYTEILGERAPLGQNAPEVRALRESVGNTTGLSDNPSKHEIRQSIAEHLWDPQYYRDLGDGPNTSLQKQVHLQAYSLMMLDDLIAKTEKIALLYSMQLGHKLDGFGFLDPNKGAPVR
ncbi:MAG: hypothetical protein KUG81_06445 [Gammaproteobacteria bacterium]|nr:hypothetical protein [Gammaproteobacteria bacterium]